MTQIEESSPGQEPLLMTEAGDVGTHETKRVICQCTINYSANDSYDAG